MTSVVPIPAFEPRTVVVRDGRRVRLRRAEPGDAEAFVAFRIDLSVTSDQLITQAHEVSSPETVRKKIEGADAAPGWLWMVALPESEDRVIGDCVLKPLDRAKLAHNAIMGMGLAAGWRGAGLGRAMLTEALGWARSHPALTRVELSVLASNAAGIALYRSLGFVEQGRLVGRIRQPDGTEVDEVVMGLRV